MATTATVSAPTHTAASADQQRRMYELMTLMKLTRRPTVEGHQQRRVRRRLLAAPWSGRPSRPHSAWCLRHSDHLVTNYRGLHDHVGKGVPVAAIMAELLGKQTAPGQGKGGTLHLAYPEAGSMLSTGIVGAGLPVGVGLALSAKQQGIDRVTAVTFGDGATNTGSFHESLEHGRRAESAGGVRVPEQPVRRAHRHRAHHGGQHHRRAVRGLRHARCSRGRQQPRRGVRRVSPKPSTGPGPVAARRWSS